MERGGFVLGAEARAVAAGHLARILHSRLYGYGCGLQGIGPGVPSRDADIPGWGILAALLYCFAFVGVWGERDVHNKSGMLRG